jgi:hypothetical protein
MWHNTQDITTPQLSSSVSLGTATRLLVQLLQPDDFWKKLTVFSQWYLENSWVRSPAGEVKGIFFTTASRPTLRPTQTPIQWAPGVKRPECETDHSPPTSAKFRNTWSYSSSHQHDFMTWYVTLPYLASISAQDEEQPALSTWFLNPYDHCTALYRMQMTSASVYSKHINCKKKEVKLTTFNLIVLLLARVVLNLSVNMKHMKAMTDLRIVCRSECSWCHIMRSLKINKTHFYFNYLNTNKDTGFTTRPRIADGEYGLQNILNKQSQTADKGWTTSLVVERGANNSSQ